MRRSAQFLAATLLTATAVFAANAKETPKDFDAKIRVERADRAIVEVKGVACSFCAYGTEKNLARLKFVNPIEEEFGGDGVLLDVKNSRIVLAVHPERPLKFDELAQAIRKGGYTFVAAHVKLVGTLVRDGKGVSLRSKTNPQRFALRTGKGEAWKDEALLGKEVVVQGVASGSDVTLKKAKNGGKSDAEKDAPISVRVKTLERLEPKAS